MLTPEDMISNDSNTAVELNRLYLSFDGQPVLKNLHLSIFPGDKVTLTGPVRFGKIHGPQVHSGSGDAR